jgi:hypothetical protein
MSIKAPVPLPANAREDFLPLVLRRVISLTLLISLVSVVYASIASRLHVDPIYYRALSAPHQHFTDFSIYELKFRLYFHTAAFFYSLFPFTYPAPVALVYQFFFRLFPHPERIFVAFSLLAVLVPALLFALALRRRGIATLRAFLFAGVLFLCSWPAILVVDRGNMEIVVWIVLATATWAFVTGRGYLAAVFFGIAASLKLFPFIFLGLFLSTRRYRELAVGIASFALVSVLGLAALGPTIPIAFQGINDGLHFFQVNYMGAWNSWENGVDHSLFAMYKFVSIVVFHHPKGDTFVHASSIYNLVMAAFGVLLYFIRIRVLPLLNQLLILSIASILFTGFSGDGTLFHLYYAFALLCFLAIDAHRCGIAIPGLNAALYLLTYNFCYEGFFVVFKHRFEGEAKCLFLIWLLVVAFRYPFSPTLAAFASDQNLAHPDASLIEVP